jgi:micrococcal nuclease
MVSGLVARVLVAVVVIAAIYAALNVTGNMVASNEVQVSKAVDGDTIRLSTGESVRLLNIDTPERGQYGWAEATARMTELVSNRTVALEADQTDKDRYGRLLRYVYVNGTMLNLVMVREGFARAHYIAPDGKHLPEIVEAEGYAKSRSLGIWKHDSIDGAFCVWVYDIRKDPKGRDEDNLNGEYVVLRNSCNRTQQLTGWILSAERGNYTFPLFSLDAKRTVTIHSGSGGDNATDLYWGSAKPVWKNEHDTLLAFNSDGVMALEYAY